MSVSNVDSYMKTILLSAYVIKCRGPEHARLRDKYYLLSAIYKLFTISSQVFFKILLLERSVDYTGRNNSVINVYGLI